MKEHSTGQRGIALLLVIFALLIVTSIGLSMMFMSDTETSVNANFRDMQTAYYAARSGVEEARDRMSSGAALGVSIKPYLPAALPGSTNGVLYILNPANGETVAPWSPSSDYFDDEICKEVNCSGSQVPTASGWYQNPPLSASSVYAASPKLPYKWVRVNLKTNQSAYGSANVMYVNGNSSSTSANNLACWNGTNETVIPSIYSSCEAANGNYQPVYLITALAVTPSGSRRMVQYEVIKNLNIPILAALYTKLATNTGQALNITGMTDPICNAPSLYGAVSGTSSVTTPGGGNVTGSPAATANNYGWTLGDLSGLIGPLQSQATNITTLPGVTGPVGNPPNYSLPSGNLGVAPTVTFDRNGAITAMSAPGTPLIVTTPSPLGTLTLGGSGSGVTGQGVLIVNGNLTLDVSHGFSYYGLILVTGNLTMVAPSGNVNPSIHGAIISAGAFSAPISNFGGSISVHQNACLVQNSAGPQFYRTVAVRERVF